MMMYKLLPQIISAILLYRLDGIQFSVILIYQTNVYRRKQSVTTNPSLPLQQVKSRLQDRSSCSRLYTPCAIGACISCTCISGSRRPAWLWLGCSLHNDTLHI